MMQKTNRTVWEQKSEKIAREYAARANVKVTKVSVDNKSSDVQACASFTEIELSQGLIDCVSIGEINEASLHAVIAHEIGHILRREDWKTLRWKLAKLLPIDLPLVSRRATKQHFYTSEFAADQTAVELTDAETVITALRELEASRRRLIAEGKISARRSWFDYEHPTTDERIVAIRRRIAS